MNWVQKGFNIARAAVIKAGGMRYPPNLRLPPLPPLRLRILTPNTPNPNDYLMEWDNPQEYNPFRKPDVLRRFYRNSLNPTFQQIGADITDVYSTQASFALSSQSAGNYYVLIRSTNAFGSQDSNTVILAVT